MIAYKQYITVDANGLVHATTRLPEGQGQDFLSNNWPNMLHLEVSQEQFEAIFADPPNWRFVGGKFETIQQPLL